MLTKQVRTLPKYIAQLTKRSSRNMTKHMCTYIVKLNHKLRRKHQKDWILGEKEQQSIADFKPAKLSNNQYVIQSKFLLK